MRWSDGFLSVGALMARSVDCGLLNSPELDAFIETTSLKGKQVEKEELEWQEGHPSKVMKSRSQPAFVFS